MEAVVAVARAKISSDWEDLEYWLASLNFFFP